MLSIKVHGKTFLAYDMTCISGRERAGPWMMVSGGAQMIIALGNDRQKQAWMSRADQYD